jgi:hypothetical protein
MLYNIVMVNITRDADKGGLTMGQREVADIFSIKDAPQELQNAQAVLEAQLRHTANLIQSALTDHPHFTDDCGEYLRSALELSAFLASRREDGLEALLDGLKELAEAEEVEEAVGVAPQVVGEVDLKLENDFASDGVAGEVFNFVLSLATPEVQKLISERGY